MIIIGKKIIGTPQNVIPKELQEFIDMKCGAFIHWGMTTFRNQTWWSNQDTPPPLASVFTFNGGASVFNTWGTQFASTGRIKYAVLTVKHHYGFTLYPRDYSYNNGVQFSADDDHRTLNLPQILQYGVHHPSIVNSVSQTIVPDFCNGMRANGIQPCFYYSLGHDLNRRGGLTDTTNANDTTGEGYSISEGYDGSGNFRDFVVLLEEKGAKRALIEMPPNTWTGKFAQHYLKYFDFLEKEIEYLSTFNPFCFWFDIAPGFPYGLLEEYVYQVVKRYNKKTLVAFNTVLYGTAPDLSFRSDGIDTKFAPITNTSNSIAVFQSNRKPCIDIVSHETGQGYGKDYDYQNLVHNGVTYRPAFECVSRVFSGSYWNISSKGTIRPQSEIQLEYDEARVRGANLLLNVSPDTSGIISTNQIDCFTNLTGI